MPLLSRYFLRLSLLHLLLGFTLGAALLVQKGWLLHPALWLLRPLHVEVVIFGWILQLVMGVAYWILPRFSGPPLRGREMWVWLALVLLNGGIFLNCLAVFSAAGAWLNWPGRLLELLAVFFFAANAWPRVKPFAG